MTLEKAIKHLERHYVLHLDVFRVELDEAAKLGIEALKDIQHCRTLGILPDDHYLPGETKE